ncbi:MAG TPA: energy transducer TonB [Gammaproteobacteria bacterium]|nr:energy transducer TonB [Gammaproteobacteria bacterium]
MNTSATLNPGPAPAGKRRTAARVTDADRLGLTLFLALALHTIIILGISFTAGDDGDLPVLNMEITLVTQRADEAPEDADYLAQAHQLGGGNTLDRVRAMSPFSNPNPVPEEGFAPDSRPQLAPPPLEEQTAQTELITAPNAPRTVGSTPHEDPVPITAETPTAAQIFERSREIARLAAEINRIKQTYQQTPRHTHVNGANARQYRFAAYMDAWRAKVERVGNLNYPEAAIRQNLSGNLLLDVAINADGSLNEVRILRSSGQPVLDEAAIRIVRMAAPFPPLPQDIKQDTDILHIPRVWRFKNTGRLSFN